MRVFKCFNSQKAKFLLNYVLFLVVLLIGWFFLQYRSQFDPGQIKELRGLVDDKQGFYLEVSFKNIDSAGQNTLKTLISNVFSNPRLKKPLEVHFPGPKYEELGVLKPKNTKNRIKLEICGFEAEKLKKTRLLMVSPVDFLLELGFPADELNEKLVKTLRSLITSVSSEASETDYEPKTQKKAIFDVFFVDLEAENDRKQAFKAGISKEIVRVLKLLGWEADKIRVNIEDIRKKGRKPEKTYNLEEMAAVLGNKHRISSRKTLDFLVFVYSDAENPFFYTENQDKVDYFQAENSFFFNFPAETAVFTEFSVVLLKEMLGFQDFFSIKDAFPSQIALEMSDDFLIESFYLKEKLLILKNIDFQLKTLEKQQNDADIVFSEGNREQISSFLSVLGENLIDLQGNDQEFVRKIREIDDFNRNDQFGVLDTFPEDYLLGVYLPLVVPLVFPVLQAVIQRIKAKK